MVSEIFFLGAMVAFRLSDFHVQMRHINWRLSFFQDVTTFAIICFNKIIYNPLQVCPIQLSQKTSGM